MYIKIITIIACVSAVFFNPACKKNPQEIMEKEMKLSGKAEVNVEIKKLRDSLGGVKEVFEKAQIHTKIANIQAEKGDVVSAINSSREAIKYQPNQYLSYYLLGKSYIGAGRYTEAVDELRTSISLKADYALSHFELGNAYYKMMKYREAEGEYRTAVKLDDSLYQAHNNLGVISSMLGNTAEAVKEFEKVKKLAPELPTPYKNLGIIYDTKLKQAGPAIQNYRKYIQMKPDCAERPLVLFWIKELGG